MILHEIVDKIQEEYTDQAILITDTNLERPGPKILWVNSAWERLTGYSLDEVLQQTPRIAQGDKASKIVLKRLKENLLAGEIFEGCIINYRKDGSEYCKVWRITPLIENNKIQFFLVINLLSNAEELCYMLEKIKKVQDNIIKHLS